MELFHFYVDSDEQESYGWYKLCMPFCRNSKGYGIFYWGLSKMAEITSIGYRGKSVHAYFENGDGCVKNYDNGMGRWGKNKLQELNRPEYIRNAIIEIFSNDYMYDTMKMWEQK